MVHEEQIKELEEEIRDTRKNKATEKHISLLKARIARLRADQAVQASKKGFVKSYAVKKSGDATALLVGFPSVGKSTLLNKLTSAESKVGEWDFTTLDVIPGMMKLNGAKIQILDVPGIIEGAASGRGMGKEVLSVIRSADLVIIMAAPGKIPIEEQIRILRKELYDTGLRLDQRPPRIKITKRSGGGLSISAPRAMKDSLESVRAVFKEFRVFDADVVIMENLSIEHVIDSLEKNKVYVPSITIVNKADILKENIKNAILISAAKGAGLDELKSAVWKKLRFMRVYMKPVGKPVDTVNARIMREGDRVKDVCVRVHKDFVRDFKFAKVWGSGQFPGQQVGLDYRLKDNDIVELHIEK